MLDWILIIIISLLLWGMIISIIYWSIRNGISPMPTSPKVKKMLVKVLPNNIEGTILELGSGWGTLLLPLAEHYPNCRIIGFETSPIPYWVSRIRLLFSTNANASVVRKDFLKTSWNDPQMVVCYLYPGVMRRLREKFERELLPGTLVISHTFAIPGWEPWRTYQVHDLYRTKIYVYQVPGVQLKVRGGCMG